MQVEDNHTKGTQSLKIHLSLTLKSTVDTQYEQQDAASCLVLEGLICHFTLCSYIISADTYCGYILWEKKHHSYAINGKS